MVSSRMENRLTQLITKKLLDSHNGISIPLYKLIITHISAGHRRHKNVCGNKWLLDSSH